MSGTLYRDTARFLEQQDKASEERIELGIRMNRKGWGRITVTGADGKPLPNQEVRLTQCRHEFQFGANTFMLDQFDNAEKNA